MSWGSALGEIRTDTVLRINERGESTEPGGNINRYATAKEFWELIVKTAKVVGARKKWRAQGDSNSRPLAPEANLETLGSWFVYQ